ncbi:MAG TPA: amidohydrolase, partial [Candidatus Limnocylindrales bacterium]|nr:amidohydrolase [Candidatus Limnocylindrales bacterium]
QPAEEVLGGAQPMIDAGALENPHVEEIYGLHLTTLHPVGVVQVHGGPSMASADAFTVEVRGAGGHGAMPHLSIDPITVAANILLGMQSLISREVAAQDTAVLTVGQIVSGTKGNIIPERAMMTGTIRAFEQTVRDQLVERLGVFVSQIAKAYRAEATMRLDYSCPAVVNPAKETAFVRDCVTDDLGAAAVSEGKLVMASDDMSLFLRERPGCYFRVGIAPQSGRPRPHHAPEFEMNEAGLPVGLRAGLGVMLAALAG